MKPADADFGVTVDFKKGESDPVAVFEGISALLEGFKAFDRVAIGSLDPQIEPIMVLEDVEASSITTWLRTKLRQTDDQAIRDLDWKKQVGSFAVKAKYRALEYLDRKVDAQEQGRIAQLRDDLYKLAQQPEFEHLSLFKAPIPLEELVGPLDQIQDAKRLLERTGRVIVKTDEGEYEVDLTSTKKPSEYLIEPDYTSTSGEMDMYLLVRRPDYLGNAQWEFRHGKNAVNAHITDEEWLEKFRSGDEVIVPGNSLYCRVSYEYKYDKTGGLVSQKYNVVKVYRIIAPSGPMQVTLWPDDEPKSP